MRARRVEAPTINHPRVLCAVLGGVLAVAGGACGGSTNHGGRAGPGRPTVTVSPSPSQIYAERCAACHGSRGEGSVGPRLGGGTTIQKYPRGEAEEGVVANGKGTNMPAFRAVLTPEEIHAVVSYTRTL